MAGTITMGGVGSGIDTESIVSGLVQASRGPLNILKTRIDNSQAAVSALSDIGTLLAKLKTAADAMATSTGVSSYKASSSNAAVAVTSTAGAQPGSFDVIVEALAKEQRTYSSTFASASTALGQTGTLDIQLGTGTPSSISITADDTLDSVASKINSAGLRASAAVFYDGSNYRLQIRGLDTGAANNLTFGQTGVSFGLNAVGATYQAASDSRIKVDNFLVTRSTNQITGAIPGVTLALTAETGITPLKITVETESKGLDDKAKGFVDAFNGVVKKIQEAAGSGSLKARYTELAGDSTLRGINDQLRTNLRSPTGSGAHDTLASVGIQLTRDGTLQFDAVKFGKALSQDQKGVEKLLAGTDSTDGVMDILSKAVDRLTKTDTGLLTMRKDGLSKKATDLTSRFDKEEARLTRYGDLLRRQFTKMDSAVGAWNLTGNYLSRLG